MSRNDDSTIGNLLDYLYHQKYHKLIGKDLSRQTNTSIPKTISFLGMEHQKTLHLLNEANGCKFMTRK